MNILAMQLAGKFFRPTNKNLYNPALASDGKLGDYGNGNYLSLANFIMAGRMAVIAGKTYTVSIPSTEGLTGSSLYCYNSAGTFIGVGNATGGYTAAPGLQQTTVYTKNSRKQITFTLAATSPVAYVDWCIMSNIVHTTADFDRIRKSVQLEIAPTATPFQPYGVTPLAVLSDAYAPIGYSSALDSISALQSQANGLNQGMTVVQSNNMLFIITPWDSLNNLVEICYIADPLHDNAAFGLYGQYITQKVVNSQIIYEVWTAGNLSNFVAVKTASDDIVPAYYNTSYSGGDHGPSFGVKVTATAHGKTVVDAGSQWTDGAAVNWTIMKVIDANNLLMLSDNTSGTDLWTFAYTVTGNLTHTSGATHTGAITVASQTSWQQITPAINNMTTSLLLNGKYAIPEDGAYICNHLVVINSYSACDLPAMLAYVKSKVGSSAQPAFNDNSIAASARFSIRYRFNDNGSCAIFHSFRTAKQVNMGYAGFVQADQPTVPTGGTLHHYIPQTATFTVGSNSYSFQNVQDITSLADNIALDSAKWASTSVPPSRFIAYAKTSGGAKYQNYGFACGYITDRGAGVPAIRQPLIAQQAYRIYASGKKMYPYGINQNANVAANSNFDMVAFRAALNYNLDSDATCNTVIELNETTAILHLDYHTSVNKYAPVPTKFAGRTVTAVESSGLTVGSSVVSTDGVQVSGTGYAVLRLSA